MKYSKHLAAAAALVALAIAAAPFFAPRPKLRGFGAVPGGGFVPPTKIGGGAGGAGDITDVIAGNGLTGGAASGAATVDVAVGTGLSVAANAVNLNLAGASCGAGQFVSAISATGTGTCTAEPGDISQVATPAAGGLTGGGASGVASVSIRSDCATDQVIRWDGDSWECSHSEGGPYAGRHFERTHEWLQQNAYSNNSNVDDMYTCLASGTGATCGDNNGTDGVGRPGVHPLLTGSTTTGRAAIISAINGTRVESGVHTFELVGGFPNLSTAGEEYAARAGFFDTASTVDVTDGCYFLYDRGNVATSGPNSGNANKLSCWCANNATRTTFMMDGTTVSDGSFTTVDAPVAALTLPSTNILHLRVVVDGVTPQADFYVNGVKSCQINNNIPTSTRASGFGFSINKSAGTTVRHFYYDWSRWAVDLTAARSP